MNITSNATTNQTESTEANKLIEGIMKLSRRDRLQAMKGMLQMTNRQIASRIGCDDERAVSSALHYPDTADLVERLLTEAVTERIQSSQEASGKPGTDPAS